MYLRTICKTPCAYEIDKALGKLHLDLQKNLGTSAVRHGPEVLAKWATPLKSSDPWLAYHETADIIGWLSRVRGESIVVPQVIVALFRLFFSPSKYSHTLIISL
jgi:hypothetical protein